MQIWLQAFMALCQKREERGKQTLPAPKPKNEIGQDSNETKDGVRARDHLLRDRNAVAPPEQALLATMGGTSRCNKLRQAEPRVLIC